MCTGKHVCWVIMVCVSLFRVPAIGLPSSSSALGAPAAYGHGSSSKTSSPKKVQSSPSQLSSPPERCSTFSQLPFSGRAEVTPGQELSNPMGCPKSCSCSRRCRLEAEEPSNAVIRRHRNRFSPVQSLLIFRCFLGSCQPLLV